MLMAETAGPGAVIDPVKVFQFNAGQSRVCKVSQTADTRSGMLFLYFTRNRIGKLEVEAGVTSAFPDGVQTLRALAILFVVMDGKRIGIDVIFEFFYCSDQVIRNQFRIIRVAPAKLIDCALSFAQGIKFRALFQRDLMKRGVSAVSCCHAPLRCPGTDKFKITLEFFGEIGQIILRAASVRGEIPAHEQLKCHRAFVPSAETDCPLWKTRIAVAPDTVESDL